MDSAPFLIKRNYIPVFIIAFQTGVVNATYYPKKVTYKKTEPEEHHFRLREGDFEKGG